MPLTLTGANSGGTEPATKVPAVEKAQRTPQNEARIVIAEVECTLDSLTPVGRYETPATTAALQANWAKLLTAAVARDEGAIKLFLFQRIRIAGPSPFINLKVLTGSTPRRRLTAP
jgi:hypothetical protein